jgi:hypothetical protein
MPFYVFLCFFMFFYVFLWSKKMTKIFYGFLKKKKNTVFMVFMVVVFYGFLWFFMFFMVVVFMFFLWFFMFFYV